MKKWVRPSESALAGVCAAFANATGVDVMIVRIIWLVSALCYGTGVLFYLVCWWLLPKEDKQFEVDRPAVLGVCLRLAKRSGIEVSVIRVLFFFSIFVSVGTSILVYLIAHLVIPQETTKQV